MTSKEKQSSMQVSKPNRRRGQEVKAMTAFGMFEGVRVWREGNLLFLDGVSNSMTADMIDRYRVAVEDMEATANDFNFLFSSIHTSYAWKVKA